MFMESQRNNSSLGEYSILRMNGEVKPHPYLRFECGDKDMYCLGPLHGRSFVVGRMGNGRYVISKGNGLSYTHHSFINTGEYGNDTLGLLLRKDAERDFTLGMEIEALGIKTNHMECIIEINKKLQMPDGSQIKPVLLQYDVECPYRICDAPFMTKEQIQKEVDKWQSMNDRSFNENYMIAANILIRNLRILHDHKILHNAIHEQNYTWALELLDFELSCSPAHPYDREDSQRHAVSLFPREIFQTYVVINYIAGVLHEDIDYIKVDRLFSDYGFYIEKYKLHYTEKSN